MSDIELSIVECRRCGKSFWWPAAEAMAIAGGPCCFGHEVLDVERYPTADAAARAYPAWEEERMNALAACVADEAAKVVKGGVA